MCAKTSFSRNPALLNVSMRCFSIPDTSSEFVARTSDARLIEWEEEMWRYQIPTPWTPAGAKWIVAEPIFDLARQP